MEDLIKALTLLRNFISYDKYPTACEHDVFYVCGVDMDKVTADNVQELYKLGFLPGADYDSYPEDVEFETISQEEWNNIKDNFTDCFHSYRFGSC